MPADVIGIHPSLLQYQRRNESEECCGKPLSVTFQMAMEAGRRMDSKSLDGCRRARGPSVYPCSILLHLSVSFAYQFFFSLEEKKRGAWGVPKSVLASFITDTNFDSLGIDDRMVVGFEL